MPAPITLNDPAEQNCSNLALLGVSHHPRTGGSRSAGQSAGYFPSPAANLFGADPETSSTLKSFYGAQPGVHRISRVAALPVQLSNPPVAAAATPADGGGDILSTNAHARSDIFSISFCNERFLPLLRELKRIQHRDEASTSLSPNASV